MIRYIGKRMAMGVAAVFVLITVTFLLTRLMPGSPFQTGNVSPVIQEALEAEYGLDQPIEKQYVTYLSHVLTGDLGISYKKQGESVSAVIKRAWKPTFQIGSMAVLLATMVGMAMGIVMAHWKGKTIGKVLFFGNTLGSAIPNFVLAMTGMLFFGVKLKWLPVSGLLSPAHYVLPVVTLAMYPASVIARLTCQCYLKEMEKEYITMAKVNQISKQRILVRHILPHVLLPILNYIGPASAFLLTGSFVIESIFTIPGLGREFVSSIDNRDYTMILGLTIFMGIIVIMINLLTDILCALLDPRVRKGFVKHEKQNAV